MKYWFALQLMLLFVKLFVVEDMSWVVAFMPTIAPFLAVSSALLFVLWAVLLDYLCGEREDGKDG